MNEEIRANYGTTTTLNFQITDEDGGKRTIKFNSPKSGQSLQEAVINFGNNFVLNDSANIIIGSKTGGKPIGYTADLVTSTRTLIAEGGGKYPLILSEDTVTVSSGDSASITVANVEGTLNTSLIFSDSDSAVTIPPYTFNLEGTVLSISNEGPVIPNKHYVYRLTDTANKTALLIITA